MAIIVALVGAVLLGCFLISEFLESKFHQLVELQAEAILDAGEKSSSSLSDPITLIENYGVIRGFYCAKFNSAVKKRVQNIRAAMEAKAETEAQAEKETQSKAS